MLRMLRLAQHMIHADHAKANEKPLVASGLRSPKLPWCSEFRASSAYFCELLSLFIVLSKSFELQTCVQMCPNDVQIISPMIQDGDPCTSRKQRKRGLFIGMQDNRHCLDGLCLLYIVGACQRSLTHQLQTLQRHSLEIQSPLRAS